MPTDQRAVLASIRRFDQLIAYLRDEMGWPITRDSFEDADDLFYDFTADELGIDPKTAAKIESIKRLRPLSPRQPWGIFFVKFEPKRLPVVALRRILGQVALKKRSSANSAERAAWATDDLLFVSNYGEGDQRQISFAHFSQDRADELPTLKVLGWDNLDTPLHLDQVAETLTEQLAWPDDETDVAKWRETWRSAFTLGHREVITTSKALAVRLAHLARMIRDRIQTTLGIETQSGHITQLMTAFREALIHDLTPDDFADMYAQTIAYGLLSARITNPKADSTSGAIARLPVTNPFLKELMETFLHDGARRDGVRSSRSVDFDELGVNEVVELLDDANMEAVVRDFGDRNPQEDPVIHFYELFLKEYDAKKRIQRGVFYTPRPVVSYIVRSVDELLRTEFGLVDGLADTTTWGEITKRHKDLKIPDGVSPDEVFVQILDPATGTGTFLVEAIDLIHKSMIAKWQGQGLGQKETEALWNEYVPRQLLPRLHGYELLMAPYAIAHLKIGLKLYETGYRFGIDARARIYLTNSLEQAPDLSQQTLEGFLPALAHEAQAVNEIKRKRRFTVVIGNPPYSNFGMMNKIPFILTLLLDYKRNLGEKKLNLDDDFIKFIRFGQYQIGRTGAGVLGLITNNTYIDGITHRQMRRSLLDAFDRILIVDLHGSSSKREAGPDGSKDENVFDIQQGVGISLLVARPSSLKSVHHTDIWGLREHKYEWLLGSLSRTQAAEIHPDEPQFFFVPKDFSGTQDYMRWPSLVEVFTTNGPGVKTERDRVSIHWTQGEVQDAVESFRVLGDAELRERFDLGPDSRDWKVGRAKADVLQHRSDELFRHILYRPFDYRNTWYSGKTRGFIGTPGYPVMRNMLDANALGLLAMRQFEYDVPEYCYFLATPTLTECRVFVSNRGIANLFPLYLSTDAGYLALSGTGRRTNFQTSFLRDLALRLGLAFDASRAVPSGLTPESIFYYAYGVFHSPGYRTRYAELLKINFPRLPITSSLELFGELARLGGELVDLHLMESPKLDHSITTYSGPKNPEVGRVGWSDDTVWLDAAATKKGQPATPGTMGFRGVPEAVWNFHIGGYQVCEKWLKDRKGRTLSEDDLAHYQKIVVALNETIRRMKEIDEVIEQHGGWPGAFEATEVEPAGLRKVAEQESQYRIPDVPMEDT